MRTPCVHTCCFDQKQHFVFLNLSPIVSLATCCICYRELSSKCQLIHEILLHIERYTLPVTTLWTTEFKNPLDMYLPDHIHIMLQFLIELLEKLELSITSSCAEVAHIQRNRSIVKSNLDFIKPLKTHKCNLE